MIHVGFLCSDSVIDTMFSFNLVRNLVFCYQNLVAQQGRDQSVHGISCAATFRALILWDVQAAGSTPTWYQVEGAPGQCLQNYPCLISSSGRSVSVLNHFL